MRPIPPKIKQQLAADPFMTRCIHRYVPNATPCQGRIEWEHAHVYSGRQINERWAIVPVCTYHHRHGGLDKNLNRYASILRMTEAEMEQAGKKYGRTNWQQLKDWLGTKFPFFRLPALHGEFEPNPVTENV